MTTTQHTIHPVTDAAPDAPAMFALVTQDGDPYLIGEWAELLDLHAALTAAIAGQLAEPIDRLDPCWGNHYTIARAVAEAVEYGYANDAAQMADTIRAAARAGRIRGAARDPAGRWTVPATTFRAWLVRSQGETRGRPKQAATADVERLQSELRQQQDWAAERNELNYERNARQQ